MQLLLLEFKAAEDTLDIINLYSYFYVNCVQKVYLDSLVLDQEAARSFYLQILASLRAILISSCHL